MISIFLLLHKRYAYVKLAFYYYLFTVSVCQGTQLLLDSLVPHLVTAKAPWATCQWGDKETYRLGIVKIRTPSLNPGRCIL